MYAYSYTLRRLNRREYVHLTLFGRNQEMTLFINALRPVVNNAPFFAALAISLQGRKQWKLMTGVTASKPPCFARALQGFKYFFYAAGRGRAVRNRTLPLRRNNSGWISRSRCRHCSVDFGAKGDKGPPGVFYRVRSHTSMRTSLRSARSC